MSERQETAERFEVTTPHEGKVQIGMRRLDRSGIDYFPPVESGWCANRMLSLLRQFEHEAVLAAREGIEREACAKAIRARAREGA